MLQISQEICKNNILTLFCIELHAESNSLLNGAFRPYDNLGTHLFNVLDSVYVSYDIKLPIAQDSYI